MRSPRTARAWETEILAWHATGGGANGPTEAINPLIKMIKPLGHGFHNFTHYRLLLLRRQVADAPDLETARPLPTLGSVEPL
jgi:transposase